MKIRILLSLLALNLSIGLSAQTFRFQYSHDTLGNRTSRVYQGLVPTKSGASLQDTGHAEEDSAVKTLDYYSPDTSIVDPLFQAAEKDTTHYGSLMNITHGFGFSTFSTGAYASFGVLSASASVSSSAGQIGWNIGVGIGIGNDAIGASATISYGADGFAWGLGGAIIIHMHGTIIQHIIPTFGMIMDMCKITIIVTRMH